MKCKSCGIVEVDGRKQKVCNQCTKKAKRKEMMDARIARVAIQIIEDSLKDIMDEKIKLEIWNMQYTRKMLVQSVTFAILANSKDLWALFRACEGKEYHFFYMLEDRVEAYVDKWFRILITKEVV